MILYHVTCWKIDGAIYFSLLVVCLMVVIALLSSSAQHPAISPIGRMRNATRLDAIAMTGRSRYRHSHHTTSHCAQPHGIGS
jgi:hypothetical protein